MCSSDLKRDGRRERFDRQKVLEGLLRACEKRPIPMAKLAQAVDAVESALAENPDREMSTAAIGEMVLEQLKRLDKIAYIRFASVYRNFEDADSFLKELKDLFQGGK